MPYIVNPATGDLEYRETAASLGAVISVTTDEGAPPVLADGSGNINLLGTLGIDVTGQGPGSTATVSLEVPVTVPHGGTGQTSLIDGGVLIGDGVDPIQSISLLDGQLIIGETGNDPVAAFITSSDGSIARAFGAGTIDLTVSGNVGSVTLTPDSGLPLTALAFDVKGQKAGSVQVMETINSAGIFLWENRTWDTQYVVDSNTTPGLRGTFSTIQSAIDQAVSDGMTYTSPRKILIRFGSYTEDLDIFGGCYFECDTMPADPAGYVPVVTITGNHTLDATNSFYSEGINWVTVSGDTFSGAATASIIQWRNSQFSNPDGYFLTSAGQSYLDMAACQFFGTSDGNPQFNLNISRFSAAQCGMNGTSLNFTGSIPRFNQCQQVGNIYINNSPVFADDCDFVGFNAECIIQSSGASCRFYNCSFTCGLASTVAIDYGTATPPFLINCYALPINTPINDFTNTLAVNVPNTPYYQTMGNVLRGIKVNADYAAEAAIAYIGVTSTAAPRAISLPTTSFAGQIVYVMDESGAASGNNITVTGPSLINGIANYVIDQNFGSALFRSLDGSNWQTIMVSGSLSGAGTITGNDSVAIPQISNNWNIVTASSTVLFQGSGSTETLDFSVSNLLLGSSPVGITTASDNVGMGYLALTSLTSGTQNTVVGRVAGPSITTGQNNVIVGYNAGGLLATSINNTAIGTNALTTFNSVITAGKNTALGSGAGLALASGVNNILIGYLAAQNYTGAESSNIILGNDGTLGESHVIRIGTQGSGTGQQNLAYMAGITGVTVASSPVGIASTGQLSDLGFGTAGYQFTSNGAGNSPTWVAPSPNANTWTDVTGTSQAMAINSGYLANNVALVTLTLPSTAAQFSIIKVTGVGAGGWKIAQNASQKITWLGTSSTVGVSGFISSIDANACVTLRAVVGGASTFWVVEQSEGNITIS